MLEIKRRALTTCVIIQYRKMRNNPPIFEPIFTKRHTKAAETDPFLISAKTSVAGITLFLVFTLNYPHIVDKLFDP